MQISAKMPAAEALNAVERDRIREDGPDAGFFFLTKYIVTDASQENEAGEFDFTETIVETVRKFALEDPRISRGRFYSLSITA